jgi:cytochrome c5
VDKRVRILFSAVFVVALVGLLVAACGAQEEPAPAALGGKALSEERCTVCHDLTRVHNAPKSAEEWKQTVERMVGKGAKLNQDEQAVVIEYLTEAYPK